MTPSLNPIQRLYPQIRQSFGWNNEMMTLRLKDFLSTHEVNIHVCITDHQVKIETPKVILNERQIILNESHLSYLWCSIHAYIRFAMGTFVHRENFESYANEDPVYQREEKLFTWAMSLVKEYSQWPEGMPIPCDNMDISVVTDSIFVNSVTFMLYHEAAHVINNHSSYLSLITKPLLNEDERNILQQLEIEADNYAFDCLIGDDNQEQSLLNKVLACSISLLSNLNLLDTSKQLIGIKHPDVDVRIFNMMNKVKPEDKVSQEWVNMIYNVGITLFLKVQNIKFIDEGSLLTSFDDILDHLFKCLDREKIIG
jgi:hypothetical protein